MPRIIPCLAVLALIAGLAPVAAQETVQETVDKSTLELWIEDQFSDTGRVVTVSGFNGALSAQATIDRITVADDTGVWLDISGITLDWSRSALLSGRVDISEFSATAITLLRPPTPIAGLPMPEATAFTLPELPVSIDIGTLRADRIDLGEAFLGVPVAARINGSLSLINGDGAADIVAERIDDAQGSFSIDATYSNLTEVLDLDLSLQEGPGGVVALLLDLPNEPSVDFAISGKGPMSGYQADIVLQTDGIPRLVGAVIATRTDATDASGQATSTRAFALDIGGDITALFLPEYRDFFGPDVRLATVATRASDGALTLDNLSVQTQSLNLIGDAALNADGWPVRFDLAGNLADPTGAAVLLPLAGNAMHVDTASVTLTYDAATGNRWQADLRATGFARPGAAVANLQVAGGGTISATAPAGLEGGIVYVADNITLADPGLSRAIGPRVAGQLQFRQQSGGAFEIDRLTVAGPGLAVDASGQIDGLATGFRTEADMTVKAEDFARFDLLTGLALGGSGDLRIVGHYGVLDGVLSGRIDGTTTNLVTGISQLDPLLPGLGQIGLQLDRDANGARLTGLDIQTQAARITADVDLSSAGSTARIAANLTDIGLSVPGLRGPAALAVTARQTAIGEGVLDGTLTLGSDKLTLAAQQDSAGMDQPVVLDLAASILDLSAWSGLVGRPLRGGIEAKVAGTAHPDASVFDLVVEARADGLGTGSPTLDKLVAGRVTAALTARQTNAGGMVLDAIRVTAPNLSLTGDVTGSGGTYAATYAARIADIGVFTPDFSGPLAATGQARRTSAGDWTFDTDATGPGEANAVVNGRIGGNGTVALDAKGVAPLGLANGLIAPRRLSGLAEFDLALNGPIQLSSLSGQVTTSGAALSLPTQGHSVEDIAGTLRLTGAQAVVDMGGRFGRGGGLTVTGPIGLAAPYTANLTVGIDAFVLRDPTLYDTTLTGALTVTGPLAGGAAIGGQLDLGRTELQVPSTGIGALGDLPDVTHIGPSQAVRDTLARAGTTGGDGGSGASAGGPAYPLDILINAPSRVFIRGRGLDAELGGSLTLGGTSANIQPQGQFNLIRGRLDILQQRFTLTSGSATLEGDFEPFIALRATTTAPTGTLVTIAIEGPASAPQITFSSSPDLPQDEVIAQLIFGRDLQSITPLQALQLAAAVGTLAGTGGGGIVETFRAGIGLDDFDVISDPDGNAAVRAGKYLSDNIYADVTIGTAGSSEINLNLDVNDNLTARGSFGNDGETSVGIFFEKDY